MKLLFDQGTPVPLRNHLLNHTVETAYEKGWSNLKNGDLLNRAEAEGFDALLTTDRNLRYQQNLSSWKICAGNRETVSGDFVAPKQLCLARLA